MTERGTQAIDQQATAAPGGAANNNNFGGMIVLIVAVVSMVLNAVSFFLSGAVLSSYLSQSTHVHDLDTWASLNYAHEVKAESIVEARGVDLSKAGSIPKPPR